MVIETRPLSASDFDAVYRTFVLAFSDYVVAMSPTPEQLRELLTRRGWTPELSVAAFAEGEMVAFTLNALEGGRGYDSGTGVVPAHRRHGLARRLMEESCDLLRAAGAHEYALEVIESNTKAVELYRNSGFRESRRLQCWRFDAPPTSLDERAPASGKLLADRGRARDVDPSWQNSDASIARADEEHVVIGDESSFAIVFPTSGDLAQLAVSPQFRRRGIGTRRLREAVAVAGKPLRILNVDDRDLGIQAFLDHAGAIRTVRQLEMVRLL